MSSPFPPPGSPRPTPAPAAAVPLPGGADQSSGAAASVNGARRPGVDVILVALLFAGMVALLVGAVLVADQVVPTSSKEGRLTETDRTSRRSDTGTSRLKYSYSIRGVDDDGGTFRKGVSEAIWSRADEGDRVTVERSVFTGRVVQVVGDGWETGRGGWRVLVAVGVFVLGVVLTAMSLRASRRTAASTDLLTDARPVRQPVALPLVAAVAVVIVWLLIERFMLT